MDKSPLRPTYNILNRSPTPESKHDSQNSFLSPSIRPFLTSSRRNSASSTAAFRRVSGTESSFPQEQNSFLKSPPSPVPSRSPFDEEMDLGTYSPKHDSLSPLSHQSNLQKQVRSSYESQGISPGKSTYVMLPELGAKDRSPPRSRSHSRSPQPPLSSLPPSSTFSPIQTSNSNRNSNGVFSTILSTVNARFSQSARYQQLSYSLTRTLSQPSRVKSRRRRRQRGDSTSLITGFGNATLSTPMLVLLILLGAGCILSFGAAWWLFASGSFFRFQRELVRVGSPASASSYGYSPKTDRSGPYFGDEVDIKAQYRSERPKTETHNLKSSGGPSAKEHMTQIRQEHILEHVVAAGSSSTTSSINLDKLNGHNGTDLLVLGPTLEEPTSPLPSPFPELYLAYLPHSGFHNQRIALENALLLAQLLNRTLLVPDARLGGKPIPYSNYTTLWEMLEVVETAERGTARSKSDDEKADKANPSAVRTKAALHLQSQSQPAIYVPWDDLVDIKKLDNEIHMLRRPSMSKEWLQDVLGVLPDEIMEVKDARIYQFCIVFEGKTDDQRGSIKMSGPSQYQSQASDKPQIDVVNKCEEQLHIYDLLKLGGNKVKLLQFGSLFGFSRIRLPDLHTLPSHLQLMSTALSSNPARLRKSTFDNTLVNLSATAKVTHKRIKESMLYTNPYLLRAADMARKKIKGKYIAVHLRLGEKFEERRGGILRAVWWEVVHGVLQYSTKQTRKMELALRMLTGTISQNPNPVTAYSVSGIKLKQEEPRVTEMKGDNEGAPRKPWGIEPESNNKNEGDRVMSGDGAHATGDFDAAISSSTNPRIIKAMGARNRRPRYIDLPIFFQLHTEGATAQNNGSIASDNDEKKDRSHRTNDKNSVNAKNSSYGCSGDKHTASGYERLNIPIYIATDVKDGRNDYLLEGFRKTFPCSYFLSDVMDEDVRDALENVYDGGEGLGDAGAFSGMLEAILAGKAEAVVGTLGSTFSAFVQDVLWGRV